MLELTVGVLVLTVPPLLVGYLLLRRSMPVFWFLAALVFIGAGYLVSTGAVIEIGRKTLAVAGVARPAPAPVPAR